MSLSIPQIFDEFQHQNKYVSHQELTSGHINDTFFVKTDGQQHYVLQRINHFVFKNVPGLINNKVLVSQHLQSKAKKGDEVLQFVKLKSSEKHFFKVDEDYWNLMLYIPNSITHEIVSNSEIAFEGGKLLGDFLNQTSDLDPSLLVDVIPRFHDMSFRFTQYHEALENASQERLTSASDCVKIISNLQDEMHILQILKDQGKIPIRVTHNDTKISNILFDKNNKGLCMIDMDTVMPGIVHYDFGDAIRTICNTAAEDEKDLDKVAFNNQYYRAYLKGFLSKTKDALTDLEIRLLPLAAKTMIFIMGLRFLTDYLNNDVYYKTNYADHNLVRAKNQFKLIDSFTSKITYETK